VNTRQQYTVLIIDDAAHDRELYRRYLRADQECSYTILEEESAEAGLARCRVCEVDGILLDFLLPDANGLEFLEALNEQDWKCRPPVVMITGQGDEAIAARAIKSGAEDYLIKRRITPGSLQIALHSAITHTQLRRRLKHIENRFHTSVENMLDCFGLFSAIRTASGEIIDFRIDYLNAAALADFQLTSADLGKGLCEQFPIYYENGLFEAYCQVVRSGEPLIREAFNCHRSAPYGMTSKAYDLRVSQLEDGFVASWRDVTVRQQQLERERIINQITQQIRRSLNLEEILQTTVTEVRQFLNCDRVFIYQFQSSTEGHVAVEAIVSNTLSILQNHAQAGCALPIPPHTQGETDQVRMITDVHRAELTAEQQACFQHLQIRANLEVPILQGETMWGVLVANQCHASRTWDALDIELLQNLATQVGIATDQANLLAQAQAAQIAAERANQAKDELLAVVSHELRSPLTTVLGWAKLLQTRTLEPGMVQQALKTIERSTQTQTQLIEDLLDVSRIIHGTLRLDMVPINLIQVVETTLANLKLVADAKAIDLECFILDAPLVVMGDIHRLQQVVTNLLTNAIKFTSEFGKVSLFLEQVKPEPVNQNTAITAYWAQITVTDTGKGIDPNLLPHIFKQFFQADTQTAPAKDGLGLGLAITHRLVELHHGSITASSPGQDQGASFTVRLPLLSGSSIPDFSDL
jgi:signal transduction histidine kinase/CheY-like chemotaxis protein